MALLFSVGAVLVLILIAFAGVQLGGLYPLFGIVIPYAAVTLFIIGLVYRVLKWARAPVPFHIPTVCGQQKSLPWIKANRIESPSSTAGVIARVATEVLLFRSLFRNDRFELKRSQKLVYGGRKYLWLGALMFHWSLLIILFRHARFVLEPVPSAVLFMQKLDGILGPSVPMLYITDIIILAALLYLFLRRVVSPQMRYLSLTADYFAVLLLLAVVASGVSMSFFFRVDIASVKELALGLVSFHPVIPAGLGFSFYVHLFLVSALVAYFPFSKMMHLAGIWLSPTRNLKNDSRRRRYVNPWNPPVRVHTYEEYEDDFRTAMKKAGLPLERES